MSYDHDLYATGILFDFFNNLPTIYWSKIVTKSIISCKRTIKTIKN